MVKHKRNEPSAATPQPSKAVIPREPLPWTWIVGLTLLALAIRIPFLGRSDLWVDELLFTWDSQLPMSPWDVWAHHYNKFPVAGHLPLGAMFQNLFLHATGVAPEALAHSPLLQRIPALFWGTISVPVLYLAVRRIAGETIGRFSGIFYAVAFFSVFYSREAYHYAPLMFFSCASLLGFAAVVQPGPKTWKNWLGWLIPMTAAVLTHISGVMMPLSFLVVGLISLVGTYVRTPESGDLKALRARLGMLIGIPLISILPLLPFIIRRLSNPGMQNVSGAPGWWMILYDIIGKSFAGVTPVAFVIAVGFFAGGLIYSLRRPGYQRYLVAVILLLMAMVTIGSLKSQYSARYFTVASPGICLIFAAGFYGMASLLSFRLPARAGRIGWGLIIAFSLIQVLMFHRLAYQLEAKARNYGGMADWINQQVPAGGAYLLESGYDVRFLGQYHQTPERTPLVPYFHSTAADVQRLRDIHQGLMTQYPEVPFVEASRHGTEFNANVPVWTWPHSYYRQHIDLWNYPLQRLVTLGIWPQIHAAGMPDIEYHTTIWYNTDADSQAIAREQGKKARFVFPPNWSFAQVAQGVYMRAHPPSRARIDIQSLGAPDTTGRLRIEGAVAAQEPIMVRLERDGNILASSRWTPGNIHEMVVPDFSVSGGSNELWLISDLQKQTSVQAILLRDIELE